MNAAPASGPDVTIVMATRNRAGLLPEAVASVRAQAGVTWELVIVDDASSDATPEYLRQLDDPRIVSFRNEPHRGHSGACNRGLENARGEFVMFMDDDDLIRSGGLALLVSRLRRKLAAVAAAGARYDWFCDGRGGGRRDSHPFVARVRDVFDDLLFGWSAVSAQNIYRTEIARQVGGFDEAIINVQDRDFWLRVARHGPVLLLPETVMTYRVHPGQSKPPNVQQLRERVFASAIRKLPRKERRRALRIRVSSRCIQAAEAALAGGEFLAAAGLTMRALSAWPGMLASPLVGPWVARRLLRRVWHRWRANGGPRLLRFRTGGTSR